MKNNLVSIIVPIYNAEKTIVRCVESLVSQTYSDIEIILIDDGSKDKSANIMREYQKNNKIRLFFNENHGVSYTRNFGIKQANGKYITFVDSDDYIDNKMIELLLSHINKYDIVIGNIMEISKNKHVPKNIQDMSFTSIKDIGDHFDQLYMNSVFHSPVARIYYKDKIQECFNEAFSYGEDLVFNLKYMQNNQKIKIISDSIYYYDRKFSVLTDRLHENELEAILNIYKESHNFYISINSSIDSNAILNFTKNNLIVYTQKIMFSKMTAMEKKIKIREYQNNKQVLNLLSKLENIADRENKYKTSEATNSKIKNDCEARLLLANPIFIFAYYELKKSLKQLIGILK